MPAFRGVDGKIPSPMLGFLYVVTVVLLCLLVANLRRSTLGQQMLAVRSNERAAAATGINVTRVKFAAYAISSFIAGTAGWMYAYNFGSVSAARFGFLAALGFVAFAYIGGISMVSGAVVGGMFVTQGLVPYFFQRKLGISDSWAPFVGGLLLIVTLLQNPDGVAGTTYRKQLLKKKRSVAVSAERGRCRHERLARASWCSTPARISVSFGGVHAVVDVDIDVHDGELVGLIGPNGAGKTTFIDAVTGFVPHKGTIAIGGVDLSNAPAHVRARHGLARTWQSTELFDDLSVRENLTVAADHPSMAETVRQLLSGRSRAQSGVDDALALLGIDGLADVLPRELTQGQRKLVSAARALAARPKLLLFDEPAAGLDQRESEELGRHLRQIVDQGTPILLVDHDMGLVLEICDRVVVIEFGRVIGRGTPAEIRRNQRVVEAYLGATADEVAS